MRYSAKPGNPSKSSIRQIKLYSVAVKTAVYGEHVRSVANSGDAGNRWDAIVKLYENDFRIVAFSFNFCKSRYG